ncbi:MAG: patatin-like phospholipase family protein [Odoribacteraceae bacterium]|nr:patatin-like phospholipase family protein [Odoribacteraceae bacterium]
MIRVISTFGTRGLLLLSLLSLPLLDAGAQRKRVGLVLSGGGAKGAAHVGVLKVLEEAGVPVDFIAGTSMGAIVGGLYAIGYDAAALDTLVREQDWLFLLGDKVYRYNLPFSEKEMTEKYLVSMPVWHRSIQVPSGFVSGQNIYNLFMDLTIGHHDSTLFARLPTPFACVASNLVDGSEVVLDRGSLPLAMRASMAIPGAFAPVVHRGMVLVDGGISNNFPADVARAMGAEILIGVDVQSELKDEKGLESVMGVVDQLTSFLGLRKYEENVKLIDLHLRPDVSSYSAASFSREAVAELIARGERAARERWPELLALKKLVGEDAPGETAPSRVRRTANARDTLRVNRVIFEGCDARDEQWLRAITRVKEGTRVTTAGIHRTIARLYGTGAFARVDFRLTGEPVPDLIFSMEPKPASSVNLGFRFDTEEMAAILLNSTLARGRLRGSRLSLTGRLSINPYVVLDYSLGNTFMHRFSLSYAFRYNDLSFYYKGVKSDNVAYRYHRVALEASNMFVKNFNLQAGVRYEYHDYRALLYANYPAGNVVVKPEGLFSYYAVARMETFDKRYYPSRGHSFRAGYTLYTDNLYSYKGASPFSALDFYYESVVTLTRRVKLIPSLHGRVLLGKPASPTLNYIGGTLAGRYLPQQIPFAGVRNLEPAQDAVVVARAKLRYRLGARHYVSLAGNYLRQGDRFFDLPGSGAMAGGELGYSYDSIIGPLDVVFNYSNWTRKPGFYFNVGYYF